MHAAEGPDVRQQLLGRMDYAAAWELQTSLHREVVGRKLARRNDDSIRQHHHLLFVEHPPVYTLGKSGSADHLLLGQEELIRQGFTFHRINRGGDITYHGPGQLVVYPIFDLDEFFNDVHRYVRSLEEVVIRTLADYGLEGVRDPGFTGVWLGKRKICAIGVHLSRWTTMHGLALNVRPDLTHFGNIVPCGIAEADRTVTSMGIELDRIVTLEEVQPLVARHFGDVFGYAPTKSAG